MYKIVILIICVSLESVAQIKVPNGGFNQFETIDSNGHTYSLPVGWKEHQKNKFWRSRDGQGFVYKYDLPDADESAIALYRGSLQSHLTENNAIFSSFSIQEKSKGLRLIGKYKFSGSDIQHTIDTLKIAVFPTSEQLQSIPNQFPENATVLDLIVPTTQFEWFNLDIDENLSGNYLMIIIQLKSGSDDSYYWGYANAVIDDLSFILQNQLK